MRAVNSQMEKMNDTSKQLTEENERLKKKIQVGEGNKRHSAAIWISSYFSKLMNEFEDMEQEISLTLATAGDPAAMSTPKRNM